MWKCTRYPLGDRRSTCLRQLDISIAVIVKNYSLSLRTSIGNEMVSLEKANGGEGEQKSSQSSLRSIVFVSADH